MRMAGPDIILFVVGALLFGGAGYAIVGTAPASQLGVFNVAWEETETRVATEAIDSFRDGSITIDVAQHNVTALVFTIACADPASAALPFTYTVTVEGPNATMPEPQEATCGQDVVIEVELADLPPAIAVPGATEDEARENLRPMDNATAAVGAWTLTFTGDRAGAAPIPVPVPVPVPEPTGTLTVSARTWTPTFAPVQRV